MTTKQTTVVVRLDEVMKGYDELKKLIGVLLAPNLGTPQCVPIPPEAIKRIVAQEISFYPLDDYCEAERKLEDPVFRSIEDQNIHFLVEYEVDNEATRAHLEEVVVAEQAALVGKVILVNSVTGYLGDTDDHNCGDCDHTALTDDQAVQLGAVSAKVQFRQPFLAWISRNWNAGATFDAEELAGLQEEWTRQGGCDHSFNESEFRCDHCGIDIKEVP